ncbi:hypothetical protein P168DRAFT_191819 [Aspergillus campestris IBT 28561]|uniref:Uncharacterized protein n=1 Tax=Aspergillus campestris (strain IBT 28561) TaxID=1392248 RepID=A0A2I1CYX3_ASPC2|nr:uncharacterized protein P168DRAFT_191819 [Aspergillus campestris IBT 28561]PKY02808.1 hypothetical protein P168DRAFT_191819 [Aspergillus campestris IBT 28561]
METYCSSHISSSRHTPDTGVGWPCEGWQRGLPSPSPISLRPCRNEMSRRWIPAFPPSARSLIVESPARSDCRSLADVGGVFDSFCCFLFFHHFIFSISLSFFFFFFVFFFPVFLSSCDIEGARRGLHVFLFSFLFFPLSDVVRPDPSCLDPWITDLNLKTDKEYQVIVKVGFITKITNTKTTR